MATRRPKVPRVTPPAQQPPPTRPGGDVIQADFGGRRQAMPPMTGNGTRRPRRSGSAAGSGTGAGTKTGAGMKTGSAPKPAPVTTGRRVQGPALAPKGARPQQAGAAPESGTGTKSGTGANTGAGKTGSARYRPRQIRIIGGNHGGPLPRPRSRQGVLRAHAGAGRGHDCHHHHAGPHREDLHRQAGGNRGTAGGHRGQQGGPGQPQTAGLALAGPELCQAAGPRPH